ncbi:hypothetical protein HN592_02465 [Candidatus Woesearchaeota archaeon]|jgi:hypothetical protein|nr:hypothetical protein [Candidatus Woesearchaeota archaeon]MBT4368075.1 hypothetical protein [Candidatus Woesearchaeota archaeon]MBT4712563.1 hypothetical protein [Candidatus Woesearchaeota archaeon]MBT6639476.1 hypothetical protein [Candidatus Woesearchaeota archaeon]MBT7133648.1 hypothetical protein [Candidatus Woesearchaeota archaeon]
MHKEFSPGSREAQRRDQAEEKAEQKRIFRRNLTIGSVIVAVSAPILTALAWGNFHHNCLKGDELKNPMDPSQYAKLVNVSNTQSPQFHLLTSLENEVDSSLLTNNWRRCAAALTHLVPAYTATEAYQRQPEEDRRRIRIRSWMLYLDPLIMAAADGQKFEFPNATLTIHSNKPEQTLIGNQMGSTFSYSVEVTSPEGENRTYTGKAKTFSETGSKISSAPNWTLSTLIEAGHTEGKRDNVDTLVWR